MKMKPIPRIVVLGGESVGKSSLVKNYFSTNIKGVDNPPLCGLYSYVVDLPGEYFI